MASRLDGKVALVTGGSRGIGKAIAHAMAAEGAQVVIASRKAGPLEATAAEINEAIGADHVVARACHVGQADATAALVDFAWSEVGPITALVNNAATNPYFGPLLGTEEAAWDKTFEVNVKGAFRLTQAVCKRLMAEGLGGSVVSISSILGLGASPLQGVYGMTKAALISMTRTLAIELGGANIRVNCVAPGLVDTRFAAALTASPQVLTRYTDRTGPQRVAQPEEIAGAVVYLSSDEASYVTGSVLSVDGGYTAS